MNVFRIKNIETPFIINAGEIYNLDIENISFFSKLIESLITENSDLFSYYEDLNMIDYSKKSLVIYDIFSLDPNNKKTLNALYKKINDLQNLSIKEEIEKINFQILNILTLISLDFNQNMEYELDLDISKILSLYKFSFSNSYSSILEKLLVYIKANLEVLNFNFIISINTLSLFNEKEIELLKKEFELLNLTLININLVHPAKSNLIKSVTIDDDLCEF